jgi:release factor glutamine methyltransferase
LRSPAAVSTTHPRNENAGGENAPALTIAAARRAMAQSFRAAGLDSPELDARILVGHALGLDQAALAAAGARVLASPERDAIEALARRRLAREPVARIVGYKEFWSLKLSLTEATLVPRPETETVVEAALAAIDAQQGRANVHRIADLGTGSGALLLALMSELPSAFGIGTDTSERALAVARANARRLGVAPAAFVACDMAAALRGPFDLIVSNPPYVRSGDIDRLAAEVRDFDPRLALDGGADGLECYRAIATAAPGLLAPDGVLVVELGAGQAPAVAALFAAAGLAPQAPRTDLHGKLRALPATIRPRNPA